jgi:ABC-2 type transport system permease protein
MAVYERTYRRYDGELTPAWSRFLIVSRYALREVFRKRLFVAFFALCFVPPFISMLVIYFRHNLPALQLLEIPLDRLKDKLLIDARFFWLGMWFQGIESAVLVLLVAPALLSPDLRNNGLALYLSRPFSRAEYVAGKLAVLVYLLSLITWVPGLLLFLFQGYLEGAGWIGENLRIAGAVIAGSWMCILALSLPALAISAWVKWRPVARIALIALFLVPIGFAKAVNLALDTHWAWLLSLWHLIAALWAGLFGVESGFGLPAGAAAAALAGLFLACLWLLARRVRAYEVVR